MKPTTWPTALRRGHHDEQAEEHHGQREGEVLARQRIGLGRDAQHHHHRERHQRHAGKHGGADADRRLDLPVDAELLDDAVERQRNDDAFQPERDRRRHVRCGASCT